jgi:hypothetical protein
VAADRLRETLSERGGAGKTLADIRISDLPTARSPVQQPPPLVPVAMLCGSREPDPHVVLYSVPLFAATLSTIVVPWPSVMAYAATSPRRRCASSRYGRDHNRARPDRDRRHRVRAIARCGRGKWHLPARRRRDCDARQRADHAPGDRATQRFRFARAGRRRGARRDEDGKDAGEGVHRSTAWTYDMAWAHRGSRVSCR